MVLVLSSIVRANDESQALLDRFLAAIKTELNRLPNCVCAQTVERFERGSAEQAWKKIDTLRLEVALTSESEVYARAGARRFERRSLADMIGKGTVSTGQYGMMAKHVFLMPGARFGWRGETERDGRRAHEFFYEVAHGQSSYKVRAGSIEAVVGFQGSFWLDAATLDLIRLEAQAFDISPALGLSEVNTTLTYGRITVRGESFQAPVAATLTVVGTDGLEHLNRMRLGDCKVFQAESSLREEVTEVPSPKPAAVALPSQAVLELTLDAPLDPATADPGQPVRAKVSRAVTDGERVVIPQGAIVLGRVTRVEKRTVPFPLYEVGIEFQAIELIDQRLPLSATMLEAGPAAGLLRQAKRMDPTFTQRRSSHMDVLVREVQRGQGILLWEAKRGPLPAGLKMKWRIQTEP